MAILTFMMHFWIPILLKQALRHFCCKNLDGNSSTKMDENLRNSFVGIDLIIQSSNWSKMYHVMWSLLHNPILDENFVPRLPPITNQMT